MGGGLDKERKSKTEKELCRWEVYGLTRRFCACHSLGFCSFILHDSIFFFTTIDTPSSMLTLIIILSLCT